MFSTCSRGKEQPTGARPLPSTGMIFYASCKTVIGRGLVSCSWVTLPFALHNRLEIGTPLPRYVHTHPVSKGRVARLVLQAYNLRRKVEITNFLIKLFKQKSLSYFGDRNISLFSCKNASFIELRARLLAFSVSGIDRSIRWELLCVRFQLACFPHIGFQLSQRDAIFLQQVDEHLCMAQQFRILSRKMLHNLLDIVIGTHGGVELLLGQQFCMFS